MKEEFLTKGALKWQLASTMRMGRGNKGTDFRTIEWSWKWQDLKCIRMEELHFIHLEPILTILKAELTQYGLIGIKVWIYAEVKFMEKEI